MCLWQITRIEGRPEITLDAWRVYEVPLFGVDRAWTRHFVGYARELRRGEVSTAIEAFDPLAGCGTTQSGRVYRLEGAPGNEGRADRIWHLSKGVSGVSLERDVSTAVHVEIARAQTALLDSKHFVARNRGLYVVRPDEDLEGHSE